MYCFVVQCIVCHIATAKRGRLLCYTIEREDKQRTLSSLSHFLRKPSLSQSYEWYYKVPHGISPAGFFWGSGDLKKKKKVLWEEGLANDAPCSI